MANALGAKFNPVIVAAAVVVIIFGLQAAKVIVVPFLLAAFLALMTVRPMIWMQQRKVPTIIAILVILTGILLLLSVIVSIIGTSVVDFAGALPAYQKRLGGVTDGLLVWLSDWLGTELSLQGVGDLVDRGWALQLATSILVGAREVLTTALLVFLAMVFILLDASSFNTKLHAAFGDSATSLTRRETFLDNLGRYLGIKTAVSLMTGICAWSLTSAIGLDFPQLWGMLAFILNYIPTIGSIIASIPAVLLAVIQLGWPAAAMTTGGYIALNIVFGNLLEPRLLGHGVGISPLVVFIGLFFWGWVLGPIGMLLSVPLTMTVKLALETDESTHWIAVIIGSERDAQHYLAEQQAGSTQDKQAAESAP
ncbi:MAG: AI-2E family transporter [Gammaproteobacteria bacterium]